MELTLPWKMRLMPPSLKTERNARLTGLSIEPVAFVEDDMSEADLEETMNLPPAAGHVLR